MKTQSVLWAPPFENHPSKAIGFMYSPLWKNHCFWWALISGWAFISANTVFVCFDLCGDLAA